MSDDREGPNPQSIRDRLLNRKDELGATTHQLLLTRYGCERLLYRLSVSEYADDFILKGATLFWSWREQFHRPTKDIDFLSFGTPDVDKLEEIFSEIAELPADDGIDFDASELTAQEIRDDAEYDGVRINVTGYIGKSKAPVQVDVGFGDIGSFTETIGVPTLLDAAEPRIAAYQPEIVVAEKYHIIVKWGLANSRLKDYFDLYLLATDFDFDVSRLAEAIEQTFEQRNTELPGELPRGLSEEFAKSEQKQRNWQAFLRRNKLEAPDLPTVVEAIRALLEPWSFPDPVDTV